MTPLKIESGVKFTPGPWKLANRNISSSLYATTGIQGADGSWVAVAEPRLREKGNPLRGEHNARLIAAAPEMYEALKEMVERMECWSVGADIPVDIDSARAALAKAVKP